MNRRRSAAPVGLAAVLVVAVVGVPAAASHTGTRAAVPAVAQRGLGPPPAIGADATDAEGWPAAPAVSADAHLLADLDTGQVLAAGAADEARPVASLVKILTALTVLRRRDLTDRVTVGDEVEGYPPPAASVGLEPGDTWAVEDLLEGLVARSGNDAAAALAVEVGGDVPGFVALMRQDAQAVGVDPAVLVEADGLDDRNRLSARDVLVLTRVAMADRRFADIAARAVVELPGLGAVDSRNELLGAYPGADGVKTGFTLAAGRCLVASARRDGRHLVAVVLGGDGVTGHFTDARALLDHGFGAFRGEPVGGAGAELRLKVAGGWVELDGGALALSVPADGGQVRHRTDLPGPVAGTLEATRETTWRGETLGRVTLRGQAPGGDGAAAGRPGAWLVDRAYAAMRAATDRGLWPGAAG